MLDATGSPHGITIRGAHVTVENFTVRGSTWGIRLFDAHEVTIRHMRITDVSNGVDGAGVVSARGTLEGHRNTNVTVCDNVLEGREAKWPAVSSALWGFEGIVITGSGHVLCHNRISGFGDALGMDKNYEYAGAERIRREWYTIPNRAVDIYGNDVLWGADDGVELDLTQRNIRAFRNRISNTKMGISFQPIWGGPAYAFRNVIYNTAQSPYKLNNDPSGFYILHNTSIRSSVALQQSSARVVNFRFHNNLSIGSGRAYLRNLPLVVSWEPRIWLGEIDGNGWFPDGRFSFHVAWNGFTALRRNSPYEKNGVLLRWPIFEKEVLIPQDYRTLLRPLEDVTPHRESNAVDAGLVLPGINDEFVGKGPDLGAQERGVQAPTYGPRPRAR